MEHLAHKASRNVAASAWPIPSHSGTRHLDRLRLRGPNGARDEFLLAATAQNLRKLAKLIPLEAQATPA